MPLFTMFKTYGVWNDGILVPFKLFGTEICHVSDCEICREKMQ